ncbi:hypothetical protein SUSP_001162 [Sulfurospirillum sp. 'SP']|nr:hypothetical protein [Sulfurospirillum sp. 'SP']WNY98744.1 hypothetical protein SUSP_001162 [Sulfurospirillum sp. 'SP']
MFTYPLNGYVVKFVHYPLGRDDLLFNGSPLSPDNIYVIVLSNATDGSSTLKEVCHGALSLSAEGFYTIDTSVYSDLVDDSGLFIRANFYPSQYSDESLQKQLLVDIYPTYGNTDYSVLIDKSVYDFLGFSSSSGGLPNTGGFSVPDLDGNFGAYPNGSTVTVLGRKGDYTIEASQQIWAFPAEGYQSSSIVYKLLQNGKILLAPHFLVSLKS